MDINITATIKPELRKLTVSINSNITDYSVDIKGFENIKKFFKKEFAFWDKPENKENVISQLLNHFESLNASIGDFYNSLNNTDDINMLNNQWEVLQPRLQHTLTPDDIPILYSGSSEAIHVLKIDQEFSAVRAEGAYNYFINKIDFSKFNNIDNVDYFDGVIQAYEFKYAAETSIITRRKVERIALNKIKSEMTQSLEDFDADCESRKTEFGEWKNDYIQERNTWQNNSENAYNTFCDDRQKELKNLEKLYTEKLQLSGPSKYWENSC